MNATVVVCTRERIFHSHVLLAKLISQTSSLIMLWDVLSMVKNASEQVACRASRSCRVLLVSVSALQFICKSVQWELMILCYVTLSFLDDFSQALTKSTFQRLRLYRYVIQVNSS